MISLRMDGLADLTKALTALAPRLSTSAEQRLLAESADRLRERMVQRAPYDEAGTTTHMRDSIRVATSEEGRAPSVEVGPTSGWFLAIFSEFGTAHQPARPFMRPAFDETKDETLRLLAADIWTAVIGRG